MNIFVLDTDPNIASKYHNDKHVIKMIVESAQLLCTAHWQCSSSAPYKSTHKNHPCSIWVRTSLSNYKWLCNLAKSLCEEYTFRYGKKHKTESVIDYCIDNLPDISDNGLTEFALAMPDEYKINSNAVDCYRTYYKFGKSHLLKYTKRQIPNFLSN
jgi:hypothetical protein